MFFSPRTTRRWATIAIALLAVLSFATSCARNDGTPDEGPLNIITFDAAPLFVSSGQSTVITWNVTGAKSLSLSSGSGTPMFTVNSSNSITVNPTATTTYTLTANGYQNNSVSASLTVTVVPAPVINTFTAAPSVIGAGQASTLSFNVTGASTISIDNGVGAVTVDANGNGSVQVSPAATTVYTLTASNSAGVTVVAQTQVTVVPPPIITSFTASPTQIGVGQSSTLSWTVLNATQISISGIGVVTGNSVSVSPTTTTIYTLTATNTSGGITLTATAQVTVTVSSTPPPTIAAFNASPISFGSGGATTLTPVFTPTNATATIDNGVGAVQSGVPVETAPLTAPTTFTLTVTNQGGTTTATVRVDVGSISVFAGRPTDAGYQDGTGEDARFAAPGGIALDSAGNMYVADTNNDVIRKVTTAGVVTTIAGVPQTPGYLDGPAATALFNSPYGIVLDSSGNIFVGDGGNTVIREITPAGTVSTFAGTVGVVGYQNGIGVQAQFGALTQLAIDSANNLYVADALNCNIRQITPSAVVITYAGPTASQTCGYTDGQAAAARFANPLGVTVDQNSNVFVADTNNQVIREITPAGVVTTVAGTAGQRGSADGQGAAAAFHNPGGVNFDQSGYLYVADAQNFTIRRIDTAFNVVTLVGQPGTPNANVPTAPLPGQIGTPTEIVLNPATGQMYFTMTVQAIATAPY